MRAGGVISGLRRGDSTWIVPAALLVLCQYAAATIISDRIGFSGRPPTLNYMTIAMVISLVGGSIIILPTLRRLWARREPHPISKLVRSADLNAVATYLLGFQLFALQMGALTWLKEMLPAVIPYWADPPLATLERGIFGTDAWRLVPEALMHPLDVLYVTWAPVNAIALNVILCLKPSPAKARAMLSYFLIVGLMGVCGQYLLSSAGPVFYDRLLGGNQFADLMSRIDAHAPVVSRTSAYLWKSYTDHVDQIGAGISAMPSIHVAASAWLALALTSFWRKLSVVGWGYWLIIFVGSFALGWHYFLDSAVGTIGALACWAVAPKLLWRHQSRLGRRVAAIPG